MDYLETRYAHEFEPVKRPFTERLAVLDELSPDMQSDQQYLDRVNQITKERMRAIKACAIKLSIQLSDAVNAGPQ
ncbi:Leucine-rich repeat-containing protein [Pseudomonas savastanoi]|nr:Leucine-rich repeat-containing protein [Pseudomonas syringae pv. cunninghamiae]RMV14992.1 Leucine-rich repeat-containing protein [Pseudomonas savastanoi]RMV15812.1 Leucine-rich repeat-containing protein [Pseudomonas savastanoi]